MLPPLWPLLQRRILMLSSSQTSSWQDQEQLCGNGRVSGRYGVLFPVNHYDSRQEKKRLLLFSVKKCLHFVADLRITLAENLKILF